MFPALSKIQDDIERVKRAYLRTNRIIGLLTVPLMFGLMVVAKPFVLAVYGPKWEAVVPVLQILCLVGIKQPLDSSAGWIFQSQGRTDLMFRWNLLSVGVTSIAFIIGIRWGVIGIAVAYAVRSYLLWYPAITIPGRLIELSFKEYFENVASIFACSIGMSLLVWLIGSVLPAVWPYWLQLTVQVLSGSLTFLILIHFLKLQAYDEAKVLISEQLKRAKVSAASKT
jgi:PST family polysaccharide transporter